jgi:hypothetical protein
MRTLWLSIFFIFSVSSSFSQSLLLVEGKLHLDSLYINSDNLLIDQFIFEYPNLKKEELLKKVKNWGGKRFVNLKEVLVGETDEQLVFNYIDDKMYMKSLGLNSSYSWYIRLVIQIKDGKIRAQYFDDGNTYQAGSQYSPAIKARTYNLKNYFKESDGVKIAQKIFTAGMVSLKESLTRNSKDLDESIKTENSKSDEW